MMPIPPGLIGNERSFLSFSLQFLSSQSASISWCRMTFSIWLQEMFDVVDGTKYVVKFVTKASDKSNVRCLGLRLCNGWKNS